MRSIIECLMIAAMIPWVFLVWAAAFGVACEMWEIWKNKKE